MKKTYTKPEISFESFLMSTNIAGDCEVKTQTKGNLDCGMKIEGYGVVFVSQMTGCVKLPTLGSTVDDAQYDGICYHVPVETKTLFNS